MQILSGFANAIFLCFIAFSVFIEAIKRLYEPPEISTEKLILVSTLGFCVNLVGLYAFHDHGGHGHSHGKPKEKAGHGHSHSHSHDHSTPHGDSMVHVDDANNYHGHDGGHEEHHGHKAKNLHGHSHDADDDEHDDNMYGAWGSVLAYNKGLIVISGVFLHVLADTLGSVGVIVSSTLIHFFGWWIAGTPLLSLPSSFYNVAYAIITDPLASLTISILIGLSVIPLLKSTAQTLLHSTPQKFLRKYDSCSHKVSI